MSFGWYSILLKYFSTSKPHLCGLRKSVPRSSLTLSPDSVFVLFSFFCEIFCVSLSGLWSDRKWPEMVHHMSSVYLFLHREGAWGHLVPFYTPNIRLRLVLLQLRDITAAQIISAQITVVLETIELIKLIGPKDSSQTWTAWLQVFLIKDASNRCTFLLTFVTFKCSDLKLDAFGLWSTTKSFYHSR